MAIIRLKLNHKGQQSPADALRAAIEVINAVKVDYSGIGEDDLIQLRRLASSVTDNATHVATRARREFMNRQMPLAV